MTLYAQVVLGLPVDGPFDYSIPENLAAFAKVGCRARINFRNKKETGYIVALSGTAGVKTVKPVIDIIDRQEPLLGASFLELAKQISDYYFCSWGEAIDVALPLALRRGRSFEQMPGAPSQPVPRTDPRVLLIHDNDIDGRITIYRERVAACLQKGMASIILVPDKDAVGRMRSVMEAVFPGRVFVLLREGPEEIRQWQAIRSAQGCVIIGTRSAVFAPAQNLGLIIVDEEHDYGYKQDQSPHYHARGAAMIRSAIDAADLIMASGAPSVEMMHAAAEKTIDYVFLPRARPYPQIKIVDMKKLPLVSARQKISISGYLQDAIHASLSAKGKVLLFLNRKGFATLAICSHCGNIFRCPRCNVNLNFHYDQKLLRCHYCNYTAQPPTICPECNAGYVRFLGAGAEKLESELCRVFPQARIKRLETGSALDYDGFDIFVATQAALRHADRRFDLVGILGIDNSLNHVDFRSAEKAYAVLSSLAGLADKAVVIQTNMTHHHALDSVARNDYRVFYDAEMEHRKQLLFPPYRHFCQVKVRGAVEEKVHAAAQLLFDDLSSAGKPGGVSVIAVNPGQQPKLRGKYHWMILISCKDVLRMNVFLKKHLKLFRRSGIIVTVDVDPI